MGEERIDHEGPEFPYRQLAEIIRARIARGVYRERRPLPGEIQLVKEFGVARGTVRRALALLVDEGVLFVVPQRGTFVAEGARRQVAGDAGEAIE